MRHSLVTALFCIYLVLMAGCATPYQESGLRGGFEETRLDVDVYQIEFKGNGFTREQRTYDFVSLRAAELTLEAGYSFFVVLDSNDWVDVSTGTRKASTYCIDHLGQAHCFPYSMLKIQMFKSKPSTDRAYSARYLYESLTEKYFFEKDENLLKQAAAPSAPQTQATAVVSPKGSEGVPRPVEPTPKITPQEALETCDALGFERGTEGHSECALEVLTSG